MRRTYFIDVGFIQGDVIGWITDGSNAWPMGPQNNPARFRIKPSVKIGWFRRERPSKEDELLNETGKFGVRADS
jgi:hypothetical protein